jgi:hypothetical protein
MPSSQGEDATVKIGIGKAAGWLIGIAVVLGLMASPAAALTISDLPSLGSALLTYGPIEIQDINEDHGALTTSVYSNGSGGYVYVAELAPIVEGVRKFHTSFAAGIQGFTGNAGWSYTDAKNAGSLDGTGIGAFTLTDPFLSGDLEWTAVGFGVQNWSSKTPIRFWFESNYFATLGNYDWYEMTNEFPGSGLGLAPDPNAVAPVPEPATLLLLASGLLIGGAWTRAGRRQTA